MRVLEVPEDRTIVLPKAFRPADKVALVSEGNTLIIKKLDVPSPSTFAGRVKEASPPLRSIVREIQAYRLAKRARSRS